MSADRKPGRPQGSGKKNQLPALREDVLRADLRAVDADSRRREEIDRLYGDGLPYSRERLITDIRAHFSRSAVDMLEAGKKFILLKEREPHGAFLEAVRACGVSTRLAQRFMQAAFKFAHKSETVSLLSSTKLLDLALLDDQEIKELTEGGTIAGLDIDAIDRMGTVELRSALREYKADKQALEELVAAKNRKIDENERGFTLREKSKLWTDEVAAQRQLIARLHTEAERVLLKFGKIGKEIEQTPIESFVDEEAVVLGPIVESYFASLMGMRARFDDIFEGALRDLGGWLRNQAVEPSRWDTPDELRAYLIDMIETVAADDRAATGRSKKAVAD